MQAAVLLLVLFKNLHNNVGLALATSWNNTTGYTAQQDLMYSSGGVYYKFQLRPKNNFAAIIINACCSKSIPSIFIKSGCWKRLRQSKQHQTIQSKRFCVFGVPQLNFIDWCIQQSQRSKQVKFLVLYVNVIILCTRKQNASNGIIALRQGNSGTRPIYECTIGRTCSSTHWKNNSNIHTLKKLTQEFFKECMKKKFEHFETTEIDRPRRRFFYQVL